MSGDFAGLMEFGQDRLGELFAKLDAPLIEAVDVPDDPLHENFVLVHRDQRAEGLRGEFLEENAVGRLVAGENLVGRELVLLGSGDSHLGQFRADFGFGLALHEGFGLGEEIG